MDFCLPSYVTRTLTALNQAGYEAYLVGGCVRDHLLGQTPHDYDITTNALPNETAALFARTADTGAKHGTITVIEQDGVVEVTTYRTESQYSDHRKPDAVRFVRSLKDDLSRRDFTVNAMAYAPKTGLVDLFGGQNDLQNGILRTVGDPTQRFSEDALRILRLYRFACRFGFRIDEPTERAALNAADTLAYVSAERVASELEEIWCSPHPSFLMPLLRADGLTAFGLCAPDTPCPFDSFPICRSLRFLAFCRWCHADAVAVATRLKRDNALLQSARHAALLSDTPLQSDVDLKRALFMTDPDSVENALILRGRSVEPLKSVLNSGEPYRLKDLAVNGTDLAAAGYTGRRVGEALHRLLEHVWHHPTDNERGTLLALLNGSAEDF